jgi:alkylhydroperoxidase family enzyme
MAWIRTFEENDGRGLITWIYRLLRWTRGSVPNIVKVSSLNPRLLVTLGPLFRTLMDGPSPLTKAQRKMVAIVASKVNRCFY